MTEFLRQLWEPIARLPRSQQIALGVITVLVFAGIILATMWGSQKEYIQLFEEALKIEDAGKVVAKLRELNIDYKLGKDSTDILVPLTDKSYILLQLAQEKTLPQARPGWQKLIDERSIFAGTTQQEFELNYVRGLQEELENGLVRLEPIENAKVYIVKPKKEVFKEDQKEPTASIFLKLKPGYEITKEQIRAIRDWVTTAVEGLKPENIRITDSNARDLSRMLEEDEELSLDRIKSAQLKHKKEVERDLQKKLQSQFEQVFGYGKAVVRVDCTMDFDQKEAISDVVIPPVEGSSTGVTISEKLENEEYRGKDLVQDGEPGVNSNLPPGAPAYPGTENETWNEYKRNAAIRNYEFTRSKEKYVKEQGNLKRLTVSIILDADQRQLGTDAEEQLRSIAQATVGFNKRRGDVLTLMVMPFNRDLEERARRELEERQRQERTMFMMVVGLLMAIPVLLGLVYIFVRVSRARVLAQEQKMLEEAAREAEAIRKAEELRKAKLREQQEAEWERRFQDINNFFPEITDLEEKRRKVQDLRYKAYLYARDNDSLPIDFDEMTPEEQYLYKEAFKRKADGTLEEGINRLLALIAERDRAREDELARLKQEAEARAKLEERVRKMVAAKPDDAVQVLRIWLEE
ncbi:MAG: Flagellar M-ring protein FliF [Candidatus Ozemobacter sibiricus]|jgi:flagellar M-ring protein FliF|uniref:Flagellar M-ring protein FliF n=1 Tax=Candidatus Ozemobacter sibiricus TaxID=2268124 RepID=A0A367ZML7_9BACT|nr:MAG: Flagellar M-ring protein FliF [Candidatus Ozemobacter sibiricus]